MGGVRIGAFAVGLARFHANPPGHINMGTTEGLDPILNVVEVVSSV